MTNNTLARTIRASLCALFTGLLGSQALAAGPEDGWPARPLRIIVPAPPGGGADSIARILSTALAERLGQSVIVDNKPGAAGTLGVSVGLQAPADGYTFIWCTPSAQILAPRSIRYDPVNDLTPVSLLLSAAYILVVNPKLPYQSVNDLVTAARARPGSINFGTAGTGTFGHLMGASFGLASGASLTQIPFTGEGPALLAIMGGDVQMGFISSAAALPQVKAGKLRALGSSAGVRMEGIPDEINPIITVLPGFDMVAINYLSARAGTPQPIVDRMSKALHEVLATPAVRERILAVGVLPMGGTPEELGRRVVAERAKWGDVMRKANIVLE
jgi:tripartite-type tricarboxylate transporter receptor subunit TctC